MRAFLLLFVGLLLAGVGQGALAAGYRVVDGGGHYFFVASNDCYTVGNVVADWWTKSDAVYYGNSSTTYYYDGDCTGYLRAVGDAMTIGMMYRTGASAPASASQNLTLVSIVEDDVLDDVGKVPMQRVLVLVGGFLMFGLGWIAGK